MSTSFFRAAAGITLSAIAATAMTVTHAESTITPNCVETYIVEQGETPPSIARKFDVSIQQLYRWNEPDFLPLHEGEELCVKIDHRL